MVFVSVSKITHGTVGATFNVAFSVPIDELPQLRELHDKYAVMNMMSFRLNGNTADTPQTERTCNNCGRDKAMCLYCEERNEWTPQTDKPCDNCQEFDCYGCEVKQTDCGWK